MATGRCRLRIWVSRLRSFSVECGIVIGRLAWSHRVFFLTTFLNEVLDVLSKIRHRLLPMKKIFLGGLVLLLSICAMAQEKKAEPPQVDGVKIQLATFPALSPDGKKLAFSWAGDIWISDSKGGEAHQLTANESSDSEPMFSPDGKRIAFTSTRTGSNQVWVMPLAGGVPKQVTFHSEGSRIQDWYPDGKSILVAGARDFATKSASRFFRINLEKRESESLLFNAEGTSPSLSPDGKRLLFCREGNELYRKGYRGSRVSQIWLAENLETGKPKFTRIIARDTGARSPNGSPMARGSIIWGIMDPGSVSMCGSGILKPKRKSSTLTLRRIRRYFPASRGADQRWFFVMGLSLCFWT